VQLGTVIHVPFYAPSQASAYENAPDNALLQPKGPTVALRVVGIEATEDEFPSGGPLPTPCTPPKRSPRTVAPRVVVFDEYLVRLRHGVADLPDSTLKPLP